MNDNLTSHDEETYLYHYTTIESLYNIFKDVNNQSSNFKIWASHIDFINDPTEIDIILDLIEDNIRHEPGNNLKLLSSFQSRRFKIKDLYPYSCVFSLSYNQDSLPMWHKYGNDGKGVAIGIRRGVLDGMKDITYKECNYINPLSLIKHFKFNQIKSCFKEYEYGYNLNVPNMVKLLRRSMSFKNEAYRYEKEVRVLIENQYNLNFRVRDGLIIPYTDINIPIKAIQNTDASSNSSINSDLVIVLGPSLEPDMSYKSVELFFESKGIKPRIIRSEIPYRIL